MTNIERKRNQLAYGNSQLGLIGLIPGVFILFGLGYLGDRYFGDPGSIIGTLIGLSLMIAWGWLNAHEEKRIMCGDYDDKE